MGDSCATCRFFLADDESNPQDGWHNKAAPGDGYQGFGWCRRYPKAISERLSAAALDLPRFGGTGPYDPQDSAGVADVHSACIYPAHFYSDWCGEFAAETASRVTLSPKYSRN